MCYGMAQYNAEDGYHYYPSSQECLLQNKISTVFAALVVRNTPAYMLFMGVNGLSILITLKKFDYVEDCVIDSMHHIFLHVVPEILNLWFSEEYKVIL